MLGFHIHECFQVALIIRVAFVGTTGRGGGRLIAVLRGERAREGRFHGPGHHPTLSPVQVTPAETPRIC